MNRLLISAAMAALVAGCSMPGIFGQQSGEPAMADSGRTVVVREIYHETPVVYVDTVYLAEEPAPVQPVYVEEVYNEYNEYDQTSVYVHQHVVLPPPPPRHNRPGWRPREHEPRPRDRRGDEGSRERRDRPTKKEQPRIVVPGPPVQKTVALVMDAIQKSPDKPTPPDQPAAPKLQAPAKGGSVPPTQNKTEAPKLVPAAPVDKPASSESKVLQVQVGVKQATRK